MAVFRCLLFVVVFIVYGFATVLGEKPRWTPEWCTCKHTCLNSTTSTITVTTSCGETTGKKCYCSPAREAGGCVEMDSGYFHNSDCNCVESNGGCDYTKFNIPYNYIPDSWCHDYTLGYTPDQATYMQKCCIKAVVSRCDPIVPKTGTWTTNTIRSTTQNYAKQGSPCITACLEDKMDSSRTTHNSAIVGATYNETGGSCWCETTTYSDMNSVRAGLKYCKFTSVLPTNYQYSEDRCKNIGPQTGTGTTGTGTQATHTTSRERYHPDKKGSKCISACIDEKFNSNSAIVGATYDEAGSGKCWCETTTYNIADVWKEHEHCEFNAKVLEC